MEIADWVWVIELCWAAAVVGEAENKRYLNAGMWFALIAPAPYRCQASVSLLYLVWLFLSPIRSYLVCLCVQCACNLYPISWMFALIWLKDDGKPQTNNSQSHKEEVSNVCMLYFSLLFFCFAFPLLRSISLSFWAQARQIIWNIWYECKFQIELNWSIFIDKSLIRAECHKTKRYLPVMLTSNRWLQL